MAAPNIEGVSTISTYTGGVDGVTVGALPTDQAGMHGSTAVQVTGFGVATGGALTANFPGATATLTQTSEELAYLLEVLRAKGIIGK